jgi:hypothetical protein
MHVSPAAGADFDNWFFNLSDNVQATAGTDWDESSPCGPPTRGRERGRTSLQLPSWSVGEANAGACGCDRHLDCRQLTFVRSEGRRLRILRFPLEVQ